MLARAQTGMTGDPVEWVGGCGAAPFHGREPGVPGHQPSGHIGAGQAGCNCVCVCHARHGTGNSGKLRVGVRVRGMGERGESDIASRWPSITDPMCHNVDGLQQCRSKGRSKVPKLKGLGITWAGKDNIPLILAGPR